MWRSHVERDPDATRMQGSIDDSCLLTSRTVETSERLIAFTLALNSQAVVPGIFR